MKAKIVLAAVLGCLLVASADAQVVQLFPTTNGSATITTGGTFQSVLAAVGGGVSRREITIQNNNGNATCEAAADCDYCWVYLGSGSATEGTSIELAAGQAYTRYWPYVPSDEIQATCTTSNDTLYLDTE